MNSVSALKACFTNFPASVASLILCIINVGDSYLDPDGFIVLRGGCIYVSKLR